MTTPLHATRRRGLAAALTLSAVALTALCGSSASARPEAIDEAALAEQAAFLARVNPLFKTTQAAPRTGSPVLCYPDNLPQEDIDRIMRENQFLPPGMVGPIDERFWVDNRVWTGDGLQGAGGRAIRAHLTYSFPADGVTWGLASIAAVGPNVLNASFDATFTAANRDRGREHVRQSFASWHKYVGLDYTEVSDDGTPMDNTEARSPTRGDTRVGGRAYGTGSFLAYNGFPSPNGVFGVNGGGGGDMMINTSFFLAANFNNAANLYRYFRNTMAHEHGHGTGNIHSVPCNNTKLMEPFISTTFDVVQIDDRRGGGRNYGDRFSGNNSAANAVNVGDLTTRSYIARFLSTNGATGFNDSNQDWFRFSLSSAQTVTITVTPVGGTYTAGQQSSSCSGTTASINATQAGNLNVSLRDNAGTTNLFPAQGNTAATGAVETISAGSLSAGTYTVQVIDVGPNLAANQTVQLYDIVVRVTGTLANPWPIAGINKRVAANTNCWFMGDMNSQVNETGATLNAASYDWDSDGDSVIDTNDQPQFNRTFPSNGLQLVTLRVTDSNGRSATDSIIVTVFGATASLSSVSPFNAQAGTTVPVTINGVNLKSLLNASQVTVSGSGVTVIGTPVPNSLGTQVTGLSFQIAGGAAQTFRSVSVTNSDGTGTASGDATRPNAFEVLPPPPPLPGPFNLSTPVDGATNVSLTPTLTWTPSADAASYIVKVATNPALSPTLINQLGVFGTSYNVPSGILSPNQTYYWGITGLNINGMTPSTPTAFSFITAPPAPCLGDLDNNGQRNVNDLTIFLANFGTAVPANTLGDLDGNGLVNVNDLTIFLANFGIPCP